LLDLKLDYNSNHLIHLAKLFKLPLFLVRRAGQWKVQMSFLASLDFSAGRFGILFYFLVPIVFSDLAWAIFFKRWLMQLSSRFYRRIRIFQPWS